MYEREFRKRYFNDFGKKVKELREKAHMSQQSLAELSDVSMTTISKIEVYGDVGTQETINKVAKGLGVEPSDLIEEKYYKMLPEKQTRGAKRNSLKDAALRTKKSYIGKIDEFLKTADLAEVTKVMQYTKMLANSKKNDENTRDS